MHVYENQTRNEHNDVGIRHRNSGRRSDHEQVTHWTQKFNWPLASAAVDNPYGTGAPIVTRQSVDPSGEAVAATQQDIKVPVGPALRADTGYFFRVTATDPTGNNPDLV